MSSLLEELNKNKAIEDAVQPNKMSKFAYTEKAYEDNDASGVDSFDFEAEQNIPSNKLTVLQTNETIILKGFRAQASSVTRQLLNHFFGRASYNLNKVHDVVKGVLDAFVNFIGKANGVATLDENGRIPYSQLPESAMEFKGTWDASTNTPTLVDGTGDTGDFYVVSVAGTQDLGSGEIKFLENDRVIYSEGVWSKLSAGDVRTVNNIQPTDGNVTLTGDNINFSASDATKVSTKVTNHVNNKNNPHAVTLSQLGVTTTATELNYVDGVTSNVQKQLDGKATKSHASSNNTFGLSTSEIYGHVKSLDNPNLIVFKDVNSGIAITPIGVVNLLHNLQKYWFAISDMKFGTDSIKSVTYGMEMFVAVGSSGKGAYSTDGVTWAAVSDMKFDTITINAVTYGMRIFVAVGGGGKGAYSRDGRNWTAISDMKFGTDSINSVVYGNGRFVAVGINGKGAYSSNGFTWTAISDMKVGTTMQSSLFSVAYGAGKFVAVGYNGQGTYSVDGINWTKISEMQVGANIINSVAYGNGRFVACGGMGTVSYSDDGINWTDIREVAVNIMSNISSVVYGNGKFIAVGPANSGAYSNDGIIWTSLNNLNLLEEIKSVAYGVGKFVAVGDNGKGSFSYNV